MLWIMVFSTINLTDRELGKCINTWTLHIVNVSVLLEPGFVLRPHVIGYVIDSDPGTLIAQGLLEKRHIQLSWCFTFILAASAAAVPAAGTPQVWERELRVNVPDPYAGTIHVSGKYIKLSRSETVVGSPPAIGEHTDDILGGLLSYTPEQLDQLRNEGILR